MKCACVSLRLSLVLLVLATTSAVVPQLIGQEARSAFDLPEADDRIPGAGPIRRADWFRQLWKQRRSEFARYSADDRQAVVFFGDSITQGWGNEFQGHFAEMSAANRGISGDTTRGMLLRLEEDVLALDPAAIVMLMGTNDLEEQASPATIAGNMRLMFDMITRHRKDLPVVLCLVFPSSETKRRPAEQIKSLNDQYVQLARQFPQVTVVDTWTLFANDQGDARPDEFPDLLHPNEAGYAKWAAALRPVLATLGCLETEPDDFQPEPGFVSLFNGRDLTGWGFRPTQAPPAAKKRRVEDPSAPLFVEIEKAETFDGQDRSSDGRYVARHGRLIVTTPVEGRRIQQLWTTEEFPQDFVLKLEFRATPNADSGVFLRKPQLQCRDYLLAGPYKNLTQYKPQEWNELVVTVKDSVAHCTCNGEVLEEALPLPETGPIGLEGDRGQMEYRRIRIKK